MSRRTEDAWPDPVGHLCYALIYVAPPNSFEVLTNLTNSQRHLNRYFLIPMLTWIGIQFTLARDRISVARCLAVGCLSLLIVGIVADFIVRRATPTQFVECARAFDMEPPGIQMTFPVQPWLSTYGVDQALIRDPHAPGMAANGLLPPIARAIHSP